MDQITATETVSSSKHIPFFIFSLWFSENLLKSSLSVAEFSGLCWSVLRATKINKEVMTVE